MIVHHAVLAVVALIGVTAAFKFPVSDGFSTEGTPSSGGANPELSSTTYPGDDSSGVPSTTKEVQAAGSGQGSQILAGGKTGPSGADSDEGSPAVVDGKTGKGGCKKKECEERKARNQAIRERMEKLIREREERIAATIEERRKALEEASKNTLEPESEKSSVSETTNEAQGSVTGSGRGSQTPNEPQGLATSFGEGSRTINEPHSSDTGSGRGSPAVVDGKTGKGGCKKKECKQMKARNKAIRERMEKLIREMEERKAAIIQERRRALEAASMNTKRTESGDVPDSPAIRGSRASSGEGSPAVVDEKAGEEDCKTKDCPERDASIQAHRERMEKLRREHKHRMAATIEKHRRASRLASVNLRGPDFKNPSEFTVRRAGGRHGSRIVRRCKTEACRKRRALIEKLHKRKEQLEKEAYGRDMIDTVVNIQKPRTRELSELQMEASFYKGVVPRHLWTCGRNVTLRDESYVTALEIDPQALGELNKCCMELEFCYRNQLSERYCRAMMCRCSHSVLPDIPQFGNCDATDLLSRVSYEEAAAGVTSSLDFEHSLELPEWFHY